MLNDITPMMLTFNEAPNVERTVEKLLWARKIVVVDSGSTDATLEILKRFAKVRVIQRPFDSFAGQCNFGLEQIQSEWVLSLDADYVLSQELVDEIARLEEGAPVAGYSARFRYCIHGRPLRSTLYPPRTVLYRRDKARYRDEGHGHRVRINGPVRRLASWIDHDDRKPLNRWFHEQCRYAAVEAAHLLGAASAEPGALSRADRVRRQIVWAPALVFCYTLFGQRLLLDGWAGWFYVFQRTLAELVLSLHLLEQKVKALG